jgi:hypothetical protein
VPSSRESQRHRLASDKTFLPGGARRQPGSKSPPVANATLSSRGYIVHTPLYHRSGSRLRLRGRTSVGSRGYRRICRLQVHHNDVRRKPPLFAVAYSPKTPQKWLAAAAIAD